MRYIIVKIIKYKKGDTCFVLDSDNKIKYCQIIKVLNEEIEGCAYEMQDLINWRYIVASHKYCADDKKHLKGIKRISKGIKVR